MFSVCTVPARGGRLCECFGGYKTINRIPTPLDMLSPSMFHQQCPAAILAPAIIEQLRL